MKQNPDSSRGKLETEPGRNTAAPLSSRTRESVSAYSDLDLSPLAKGFCETLETIRNNGTKYRRIWLIRHFPLEKTDANGDYEKRSVSDKSKLSKEQLDQLREDDVNALADVTDAKTQEIFKCVIRQSPRGSSVALCVDSSKPTRARNKMTQEWIGQDPVLIGKFHEQPELLNVTKDPDSWKNAISSHEQVRTAIKNVLRTSHEGVLIGNRSLAWAFWLRAGRSYVSAKEAARRFWETGYDFIDFENGNPEEIILADTEILRITPDNAKSVMTSFIATATDEKEKASMSEALESLPLAWLQEAVNAGLAKLEAESPESYARFLFSPIENDWEKDADTQKFVFTKLVKLDGSVAKLLQKNWNSNAVEWMTTKNYREFVIKYFGETEEGPSASAWMFSKSFQSKETEGLYESACQYWKARKKQKRSVDPFVRKNGDVWVMPRTWQVMKAKSVMGENSEISDRLTLAIWKISPQTFEETVTEACRDGNLILSASVGKGKSIWISEFVKNAAIRWIPVRFFDARELTVSRLAPGGGVFEDHARSGAIFCFDGIDEIRDQEAKTGIKDGITNLWSRCVITTRPGEYPEIPKRTGTIWLERVNFKAFVETRYPEDLTKRIIDYANSLEIGKEIKEDPLLMAFVCLLHETEWSLPSPEKIKTKSALFEAAARFVLSDHSKTTKWQDHDPKEDVDVWMRKLAEYAMEKSGGTPKTETSRYYDSHLSLLFRDDGTGNYEFVHESFYEFFLWYAITSSDSPKDFALWWKNRHFTLHDGELKNVAWKNWRKNKLSTFRAMEMLVQRSEIQKAEDLASGFLNDPFDDPFGTSFFHGLELAWQLGKLWVEKWNELLHEWYERIGQWTEMEVALKLSNLQTYVHRNGYPKIAGIDSNVIPKIEAARSKTMWHENSHGSIFGSGVWENRFTPMERKVAQFVPIFEWDSEFRIWTPDFPVKKTRVSDESAKYKTLFSRIKEDRYEYEWNMSQITVADCAALWSSEGIRRACEYLNGLGNDRKRKRPLSHYRALANGDSTDAVDSYEDLKSKIWDELCRFFARNFRTFESDIVLQGIAARKFLRKLWVHDIERITKGIESALERWKDDTKLWALSVNLLVRAYGKATRNPEKTRYGEEGRVDWKSIEIASKKLLERMGMDIADFLDDDGNVFEERLDEITETTVDSYGNPSSRRLEIMKKEKEETEKANDRKKTDKSTNRGNRTMGYLPDDSEDCVIRRLFPDRPKWTGQKTFLHCDNNETGVMSSLHSLLESVKSGDSRRVLKKSLSDIQTYGLEY